MEYLGTSSCDACDHVMVVMVVMVLMSGIIGILESIGIRERKLSLDTFAVPTF